MLCLDTSTAAVTVALVEDGTVLAGSDTLGATAHGELLAPAVRAVLLAAGPGYDGVAVGAGPGPFTSLRVGLATAAALAAARGVPVWTACSLDLLARPDTVVVQDARRRELYWAAYDASSARVEGPAVATPDAVPVRGRRVRGAGAAAHPGLFPGAEPALPRAGDLWPRVVARLGGPGDPVTPLYLRRPDAVEPVGRRPVLGVPGPRARQPRPGARS